MCSDIHVITQSIAADIPMNTPVIIPIIILINSSPYKSNIFLNNSFTGNEIPIPIKTTRSNTRIKGLNM